MARLASLVFTAVLVSAFSAAPAFSQTAANRQGTTSPGVSRGTIVSETATTLVIRNSDGYYELFLLDSATARPTSLPLRTTVAIASRPSEEGAPVATIVTITTDAAAIAAPDTPVGTSGTADAGQIGPQAPVTKRVEQSIQNQVRRYRIGIRGSASLDPELVSFGAQGQIGPFFNENVWARPNIDFGFGEVTTLVALNFEGMYRLPVTTPEARWSMFAGGGPGLNFQNRGFDEGESRFNDFDLDVGLNLFLGLQLREGMFLELKTTAYAAPATRFVVGYNF